MKVGDDELEEGFGENMVCLEEGDFNIGYGAAKEQDACSSNGLNGGMEDEEEDDASRCLVKRTRSL